MKKIKFEATLFLDDNFMNFDCKEEKDWLFNKILKDELILHSNEIGDEVGTVKIERIIK